MTKKILFILSAFLLILGFSFFPINKETYAKADSENSSYNIKFHSSSEEEFFSLYNIESTSKSILNILDEFENSNLLLNSSFTSLTNNIADNWNIGSGLGSNGSVSFSSNSCTCTCDTLNPILTSFLYQRIDCSSFTGQYVTASVYINEINNNREYATSFGLNFRDSNFNYIGGYSINITSIGLYYFTYLVPDNVYYIDYTFGMTRNNVSGDFFTFSKPKLEFGKIKTPYFDSNYFDIIFSSFEKDNPYFKNFIGWSLDGSIGKIIDFKTYKITEDISLYPVFDKTADFPKIEYTDSIVYGEPSSFGNYGIKNVEMLTIKGYLVYKINFVLDYTPIRIYTTTISNSYSDFYSNVFVFNESNQNNSCVGCNFAFYTTKENSIHYSSLYPYEDYIYFDKAEYTLYISQASISYNTSDSTFEFGSIEEYNNPFSSFYNSLNYDMTSFVDMNSKTNFEFNNLPNFITNEGSFAHFFLNLIDVADGTTYVFSDSLSDSISLCAFYSSNSSFTPKITRFKDIYAFGSNLWTTFILSSDLSYNYGCLFTDFYFSIYKPLHRTNNTLILYNFDYNSFVSSIETITYRLNKQSTLYDVTYVGTLPNSYFISIYNEKVANMIFDEYIYVYLNLGQNVHFFGNYNNFMAPEGESPILLGFDFNFSYFNEPLVASNGVFNFTFEKPSYVEMPFSLIPFYLPVLEIIQNGLIFLMFDCPITSDIMRFIHLDEFFAFVFNVFSFSENRILLLGLDMGQFVLGCIAFIIFFRLLQSFMPLVWSNTKKQFHKDTERKTNKQIEEERLMQLRLARHKENIRNHYINLKEKRRKEYLAKREKWSKIPKIHYHYYKGNEPFKSRKYSSKLDSTFYDDIDNIDM